MNIKWDSEKYTSNFSFVHQYGNDVMELIDFDKAAYAIDLGCGNGALTKRLQEKGLDVCGIDASEEMLSVARSKYPDISFVCADATGFSVDRQADVVFSNAVFHWIEKEKQPKMLACVSRALKIGGQFVFELGGYGNNDLIHEKMKEVFARHGFHYEKPFYFPSIGEYAAMVEQAGFLVKTALLFDRPTKLMGEDGLKDWIKMFLKTPFQVVPEEQREQIIDEAAAELKSVLYKDGVWYSDYVRLRMKAIRTN